LSEYRTLRVERPRPGVVLATLDRPDRLNAISFEMFEEFPSLCAEVEADRQARVLIVTGAGRGFSAGLDLDEATTLGDMGTVEMLDGQERWVAGITAFRKLSKPVIAAVNGPAAGAGLALALVADLRIASTAARFGTAFVRIGLSGGDVGMSWMLPRIVGLTNAAEMLLTGDLVDAARAERIGLVSAVVEPAELLGAAYVRAETIVANSPFGVRLTKQVLYKNVDAPALEAAIEIENRNQVLATRTDDMREALAAFREKRPPTWTGK
jgi:enoyl-CoA hydratase/carnithine racemase